VLDADISFVGFLWQIGLKAKLSIDQVVDDRRSGVTCELGSSSLLVAQTNE
jgi:hypothetical protein